MKCELCPAADCWRSGEGERRGERYCRPAATTCSRPVPLQWEDRVSRCWVQKEFSRPQRRQRSTRAVDSLLPVRGKLHLPLLAELFPHRHLRTEWTGDRKCSSRLRLKFSALRKQQCLAKGCLGIKFLPEEMSRGRESGKD